MSEINMVPLIDVMLVLLVIFIVTAPLLTHAVKLELPQVNSRVEARRAETVDFAIDARGLLYWNGDLVTRAEASRRFAGESRKTPQPELRLRADHAVTYLYVAQTIADASRAGLTKVGFVSDPAPMP